MVVTSKELRLLIKIVLIDFVCRPYINDQVLDEDTEDAWSWCQSQVKDEM